MPAMWQAARKKIGMSQPLVAAFFLEDLLVPLRGPRGSYPREEAAARRGAEADRSNSELHYDGKSPAGTPLGPRA